MYLYTNYRCTNWCFGDPDRKMVGQNGQELDEEAQPAPRACCKVTWPENFANFGQRFTIRLQT